MGGTEGSEKFANITEPIFLESEMEIEDRFNAQLDILLKKMDDWIMAIKGMKASAPKMTEMMIGEVPVITVEAPSQYMVVPASVEVEVTLPPTASDVADPTSAPLGSVFLTAGDVDEPHHWRRAASNTMPRRPRHAPAEASAALSRSGHPRQIHVVSAHADLQPRLFGRASRSARSNAAVHQIWRFAVGAFMPWGCVAPSARATSHAAPPGQAAPQPHRAVWCALAALRLIVVDARRAASSSALRRALTPRRPLVPTAWAINARFAALHHLQTADTILSLADGHRRGHLRTSFRPKGGTHVRLFVQRTWFMEFYPCFTLPGIHVLASSGMEPAVTSATSCVRSPEKRSACSVSASSTVPSPQLGMRPRAISRRRRARPGRRGRCGPRGEGEGGRVAVVHGHGKQQRDVELQGDDWEGQARGDAVEARGGVADAEHGEEDDQQGDGHQQQHGGEQAAAQAAPPPPLPTLLIYVGLGERHGGRVGREAGAGAGGRGHRSELAVVKSVLGIGWHKWIS
ncbi:hypothetical protein GUJ93_ZPchr0005g14618 [Zizania palustris]|uniref:Uncharacterized protein n=1 Tax=Zizania palustris TaxID=103762 RepID=A0A8J5SB63_ZIZPA|nr:hypothetical protein GUJ93_ZPchr0005g14618 [Zizania palustris]